jgi:hypothetical protein
LVRLLVFDASEWGVPTMLTPSAVQNAKPRATPYKMADERSMFLLVTPSGGKLWRFAYRRPGSGKQNQLSLGAYPDVSLKRAREKRDDARKLLADGISRRCAVSRRAAR